MGGALAMEYLLFFITVDLFAGQPEEALPWLASVGIGVTYGWLVHEPGLFMLTCIARAVASLATRAQHGAQRRRERPSRARIAAVRRSSRHLYERYLARIFVALRFRMRSCARHMTAFQRAWIREIDANRNWRALARSRKAIRKRAPESACACFSACRRIQCDAPA